MNSFVWRVEPWGWMMLMFLMQTIQFEWLMVFHCADETANGTERQRSFSIQIGGFFIPSIEMGMFAKDDAIVVCSFSALHSPTSRSLRMELLLCKSEL